MVMEMELGKDLEEYSEEIAVGMLSVILCQPPSVIRQQTYRDLEAVLLVKQVESKKMEEDMNNTGTGGHDIQWQKTS